LGESGHQLFPFFLYVREMLEISSSDHSGLSGIFHLKSTHSTTWYLDIDFSKGCKFILDKTIYTL
jgi:hypothetical protein